MVNLDGEEFLTAAEACAPQRIRGCASATTGEAADMTAAGAAATAKPTTRSSTAVRDSQYWLTKTHKSRAYQR